LQACDVNGIMMWDTVVVGAGIEGSATAYDLAKRGRKTLLLEQVSSAYGLSLLYCGLQFLFIFFCADRHRHTVTVSHA